MVDVEKKFGRARSCSSLGKFLCPQGGLWIHKKNLQSTREGKKKGENSLENIINILKCNFSFTYYSPIWRFLKTYFASQNISKLILIYTKQNLRLSSWISIYQRNLVNHVSNQEIFLIRTTIKIFNSFIKCIILINVMKGMVIDKGCLWVTSLWLLSFLFRQFKSNVKEHVPNLMEFSSHLITIRLNYSSKGLHPSITINRV